MRRILEILQADDKVMMRREGSLLHVSTARAWANPNFRGGTPNLMKFYCSIDLFLISPYLVFAVFLFLATSVCNIVLIDSQKTYIWNRTYFPAHLSPLHEQ